MKTLLELELCNQAHRALVADLAARGVVGGDGDELHRLALAKLDLDGDPLDASGAWAESLSPALRSLCEEREDVRAWAAKAPPGRGAT